MAFQNPTLLPWRTTLSNVMLPLEIVEPHRHQFRRERARYRQQANALLNLVGLENFGEKYPWQLSGGMQQRASLCRSLIHEPALLMLDEPFGALDAFTREELWDVLQDLWMRRGFTTILVTHDLREAVYLADTVHVMSSRPGRIIATHDVPIERPRRPRTAYEPRFMDIVARIREEIRGERNRASRRRERTPDAVRVRRARGTLGRVARAAVDLGDRLHAVQRSGIRAAEAYRCPRRAGSVGRPDLVPRQPHLDHDGSRICNLGGAREFSSALRSAPPAWPIAASIRCWSASIRSPRLRSCRSWSSGSASA